MKIHFVGVGGVGTGTFATALAKRGHSVTGSDGALYEPMKSVLEKSGVKLISGYKKETASDIKADAVIIGNVIRRDNAEAAEWIRSGANFYSFPEAVRRFAIEDRKTIICAGTHGKTTTTSWVAFLLSELGLHPSYLIGGVPKDLKEGCLIQDGEWIALEGDEYDSAFFDKGPKFLHYHPHFAILSSIEFDHADIYRDLNHVKSSFEKLVALLPGDGLCIARFDDSNVMDVVSHSLCPVQTFGLAAGAMWRLGKVEETVNGFDFEVIYKNRPVGSFRSPLFGEHNLMNILSGIIAAVNMGVSMEKIRPIVEKFHGARRRQEILLERPILLVDDFAHHPTEVNATLKGIRRRYKEGKLWAFFEPRSATARRNVHQHDYVSAFDAADEVCLCQPFKATELKDAERFSAQTLASELTGKGKAAKVFENAQSIVDHFVSHRTDKDIVVVMSNGEFDKIQSRVLEAVSP